MAWYNTNWLYRKKVTIGTQTANLTNFPVYVNLANMGANFFSNVRTDGGDIRVTLADEVTEVPRELVSINTSTQTGEFYFRANNLSNLTSTDFYIYFGNASAINPTDNSTYGKYNVWNDFVLVAHLNENPSLTAPQIKDSTVFQNNGTANGSMLTNDLVPAKISNGLDFDGIDDFINFGNNSSLQITNNLTVEGWFKGPSDNQRAYFGKCNSTLDNLSWLINSDTNSGAGKTDIVISNQLGTPNNTNSKLYRGGTSVFDNTNFNYQVFSFNTNNLITYVNGNSDTLSRNLIWNATVNNLSNTSQPIKLGGNLYGSTGNFKVCIVDEIRISNVVRSQDWILCTYNNIQNTNSFYTIGNLENAPSPNLQSLTPAIDTTGNAANTNLILDFDQNVNLGSGNVTIEKIPNLNIGVTFQGDLAELMMLNTLTDSDRQKIEGYLAWKWFGGNNNLPSNHPYKLYAPRN
jgi:hypothetical protein